MSGDSRFSTDRAARSRIESMDSTRSSTRMSSPRVLAVWCLLVVITVGLHSALGQSGAEWTTSSGDPARDAWQRGESKITPHTAKDLRLLWKVKVPTKTMGMLSFREPLIVNGVKTAEGVRTVAILAGAANDVYAIDADNGTVVWGKKLAWASQQPQEPGE